MTSTMVVLLFAAGALGGTINAIAGGATLFTFPAMMLVGLPPIVANASSTVALTPGHLLAVISERSKLPPRNAEFSLAIAIAILGGVAGAFLLFASSEKFFTGIVPLLIGLATLVFAFGKPLQTYLGQHRAGQFDSAKARLATLVPVAVYGGYFGAGMGVMLMAAFAVTSKWELRTSIAMKNLLGALANWSAIVVFIVAGMINWPATLIMFTGAVVGGLVGAKLLNTLPAHIVRFVVIAAGTIMTVVYVWRFWLVQ